MIELTTTGGAKIILNPDLIECIEKKRETVIFMNSGKYFVVLEDAALVAELILGYKKRIRALALAEAGYTKDEHAAISRREPAGEEVETGSEIGSLPD